MLEAMGLGPMQVSFIAVWINMLSSDNRRAAEDAASIFDPHPHVAQFHDPNRLVGDAVAASIGAPGHTAWDMYLFYDPGAKWKEDAPQPVDWAHQLGQAEWADHEKFEWGESLPRALRTKMRSALRKTHSD